MKISSGDTLGNNKVIRVLKPFVLLMFVFIPVLAILNYNTAEEKLCGTITKFKMLNTGGNIGAAPIGYVGYLLDIDLENESTSIQLTSNIINPKVGQVVTILKIRKLFFKRPGHTIINSSKCVR